MVLLLLRIRVKDFLPANIDVWIEQKVAEFLTDQYERTYNGFS
jgi:hypothetical protein